MRSPCFNITLWKQFALVAKLFSEWRTRMCVSPGARSKSAAKDSWFVPQCVSLHDTGSVMTVHLCLRRLSLPMKHMEGTPRLLLDLTTQYLDRNKHSLLASSLSCFSCINTSCAQCKLPKNVSQEAVGSNCIFSQVHAVGLHKRDLKAFDEDIDAQLSRMTGRIPF